jgi:outer membrane translocation and assembly module TamA
VWRTRKFGAPDSTTEDEEDSEDMDEHPMKRLHASLAVGPMLEHTSTSADEGSPFAVIEPIGFAPMWRAGARALLDVRKTDGRGAPRRGFRLRAAATAFPALLDAPGASGTAEAELDGYVPLIGDGLHLALRAGGRTALGDYPAFDAARIGGQRTLRGHDSNRFSGDVAAFGGAELRAPLGKVTLLVRGELGVFALADAGRVWVDSESAGGWHTAYGGGVWFDAFDHAATVTFASGEVRKLYLALGLPF